MRKILFRGKSRVDNSWAYGSLQQFKGFSIFSPELKNWVTVDGNTVGEFTGMYDCNEAPIFEGDVVLVSCDGEMLHEGVVKFVDGSFVVDAPDFDVFPLYSYLHPNEKQRDYQLKIEGNIYDNPDAAQDL